MGAESYIPSVFSPSGKQTTAKEEANGSTEWNGELQCPRVTSGAPWRIQEQLGKFVEQDGCFLCRIGIDPLPSSYRAPDSLSTFNRLLEKESEKRFFGGIAFGEASITQIEQRGLFCLSILTTGDSHLRSRVSNLMHYEHGDGLETCWRLIGICWKRCTDATVSPSRNTSCFRSRTAS